MSLETKHMPGPNEDDSSIYGCLIVPKTVYQTLSLTRSWDDRHFLERTVSTASLTQNTISALPNMNFVKVHKIVL